MGLVYFHFLVQLTNDNVFFSPSVCLQTHWLFTALASSHDSMANVSRSSAPPCCSSWTPAPAGGRKTRCRAAMPHPGPPTLKVRTDLLCIVNVFHVLVNTESICHILQSGGCDLSLYLYICRVARALSFFTAMMSDR